MINITKVMSRSFIFDIIVKIQNFFGLNLKAYEDMINKGINEIKEDLKKQKIELKWYRYEITELTNGAIAIMIYGDKK